jgi:uncharacterized membrane protein
MALQGEIFNGPLPPPSVLKGYAELNPDYPERIFRMTEAYAAANVKKKYKEASAITNSQIFSFALGIAGFGAAVLLGLKGIEGGAIAATIGGIAPIVIAALSNLKKTP